MSDNVDRLIALGFKCYFRANDAIPNPLPLPLQPLPMFKKGSQVYFEVTPFQYKGLGAFIGEFEVDGLKMSRHMLKPDYFDE